jgi:hypothetical protein
MFSRSQEDPGTFTSAHLDYVGTVYEKSLEYCTFFLREFSGYANRSTLGVQDVHQLIELHAYIRNEKFHDGLQDPFVLRRHGAAKGSYENHTDTYVGTLAIPMDTKESSDSTDAETESPSDFSYSSSSDSEGVEVGMDADPWLQPDNDSDAYNSTLLFTALLHNAMADGGDMQISKEAISALQSYLDSSFSRSMEGIPCNLFIAQGLPPLSVTWDLKSYLASSGREESSLVNTLRFAPTELASIPGRPASRKRDRSSVSYESAHCDSRTCEMRAVTCVAELLIAEQNQTAHLIEAVKAFVGSGEIRDVGDRDSRARVALAELLTNRVYHCDARIAELEAGLHLFIDHEDALSLHQMATPLVDKLWAHMQEFTMSPSSSSAALQRTPSMHQMVSDRHGGGGGRTKRSKSEHSADSSGSCDAGYAEGLGADLACALYDVELEYEWGLEDEAEMEAEGGMEARRRAWAFGEYPDDRADVYFDAREADREVNALERTYSEISAQSAPELSSFAGRATLVLEKKRSCNSLLD